MLLNLLVVRLGGAAAKLIFDWAVYLLVVIRSFGLVSWCFTNSLRANQLISSGCKVAGFSIYTDFFSGVRR